MNDSIDPKEIQRLIDKEAIRSNLFDYARSVDRVDEELLRKVYWPDGYDDHGTYKGDIDGFVEWVTRRHSVIDHAQHIVGQVHIEFLSDDVAVSEAYVISPQRYSNEAEETIRGWVGEDTPVADDQFLEIVMYCRIVDRVEKRNGEWKIALREVLIEQVHTRLITEREIPTSSVRYVRGPEDSVYRFLQGKTER